MPMLKIIRAVQSTLLVVAVCGVIMQPTPIWMVAVMLSAFGLVLNEFFIRSLGK